MRCLGGVLLLVPFPGLAQTLNGTALCKDKVGLGGPWCKAPESGPATIGNLALSRKWRFGASLALAYNMVKTVFASILLLIPWGMLWGQVKQEPPPSTVAYLNSTLGFRYVPPSEMRDKTERSQA